MILRNIFVSLYYNLIYNMRYGYIYKITSPSGRIYIGKTVNLKSRLSSYKTSPSKQQKLIYRSLLKYGYDNHGITVVKEGLMSSELLSKYEIYFIKKFNSYFYNNKKLGLNLTTGGEGVPGGKLSRKSIEKMILTKKNTPPTIKELNLRIKLREMRLGKKLIKNKEWLTNNGMSRRVPILQYDLDGNFIKEWNGAIEAEVKSGFSRKGVLNSLKKKCISAYGYIWRYKDDKSELPKIKNKFKGKTRRVINIETGGVYDSLKEAAHSITVSPGCVSAFLTGLTKHKKYPFKYAEQ